MLVKYLFFMGFQLVNKHLVKMVEAIIDKGPNGIILPVLCPFKRNWLFNSIQTLSEVSDTTIIIQRQNLTIMFLMNKKTSTFIVEGQCLEQEAPRETERFADAKCGRNLVLFKMKEVHRPCYKYPFNNVQKLLSHYRKRLFESFYYNFLKIDISE